MRQIRSSKEQKLFFKTLLYFVPLYGIFLAIKIEDAERGLKLSKKSNEAWAYMIGYMTGKIYKRLLK